MIDLFYFFAGGFIVFFWAFMFALLKEKNEN
jgi:hypothetical protein